MSIGPPVKVLAAEWALASTQRSLTYDGFAALYAKEVSEEDFKAHFAHGRFAPFTGLEALGLGAALQRLDTAIEILRREPLARLELAADFAQLFLLDARTGALPYASAYEGEGTASILYSAAETRMREMLSARALAVESDFREPADHLAILLSLLAHVAKTHGNANDIGAAAHDQATLLRTSLLDWLPRFVDRCQQATPRFDVYPALASLLLGFAQADLLFLEDIAAD